MPLSGGGTASKPSGTTATPSTTIESAKFNSVIDDIYSIFNTVRPLAYGGTGATTAVGGFDALAAKGTDIASASTINLTTATGPVLTVTGTTTVTAATLAEGRVRFVRASGAFKLEAGASLIVNGSTDTDYTTTAGDLLMFIGYASNITRVDLISPAPATALPAASTTQAGIIEASTTTELLTGTSAALAATPDAVAALWEKGSDVASASTVSLGEGGYFHITGTTTITDIDFATAKDGRRAVLVFDGILTLTHNSTTLVLPGGANITTAAGDSCFVVQDASDNVKVVAYQRASGLPVVTPTDAQPTPTTSTLAVGSLAVCTVQSGTVADGATISGSSLRLFTNTSTTAGAAQTGTWKNVSGSSLNDVGGASATRSGYFVRTA